LAFVFVAFRRRSAAMLNLRATAVPLTLTAARQSIRWVPQYAPMQPSLVREPFHRAGWIDEEQVDGGW